MVHANARLTPAGRLILVQRIQAGRPAAHVAAEMGISQTTAYRWWARYRQEGIAGLHDRPSRAHTHPNQTPTRPQPPSNSRSRRCAAPASLAPPASPRSWDWPPRPCTVSFAVWA